MKRGTPDHPKTKALMAALDVPRYQAVGLLESLWHFAAQYAKRGDVGRWENTAIGTALDWKGDPDALMQAFISSGYLEECPHYRLLIHDWETHCDQTVQRSEEVKKQGFARNQLAKASQPEPMPKANAISQSHSQLPGLPPELGGRAPELWQDFIRHRKEIRKPLQPTAASRLIAKLVEIGTDRAVAAMEHSIANGWQGIFEPQQSSGRQTGQPTRRVAKISRSNP